MEPRLSMVTLGVANLDRARAFYSELLGWKAAPQSGGEVVFYQAGGVVLALYPRALLAEDARLDPSGGGFGGITLAHNVREREEVDRVLDEVARRGARILKPAEDTFWGGRSGYFADPDGNPWEVAWNPGFPLDRAGTVRLEAPARKPRTRKPAPSRRRAGPLRRRR